MPRATGSLLGPYEVVALLGAGGMGQVYRARDHRLKRDVAIKVLPDDVAMAPDRLARFEREATTVAGLNHPNIVTLFSIEEAGDARFITMELVEGETLSASILPDGLPLPRVIELGIPIADALVAAHEKGVIHRDLKPANVMVTRDGRVKVLDFGLAKLAQADVDLENTQAATQVTPISEAGAVLGTAPYMAPEQLRGEEADARSDLFSFGILLYELTTGRRPFAGNTFAELSSTILRDDAPSLTSVRANAPDDLERIIGRCLAKQPRERFQTALDVANELRGLKRTLERGVPPAPRPPSENVASIAVLPFVNRSASADDEYFSDGLADELLNLLARIKGLRVAARTSSFVFKGKEVAIDEIGRALNVATVLEGSVRKIGMRVRISVQLVKVADGYQLWSETYDRTLDDIFAVQDDITRSVVKELRARLLGEEADSKSSGEVKAEVSQAARGRATDPEAHRLYLMARYFNERLSQEDVAKTIEYLKQALAIDPEFALAWAVLGNAYARQGDYSWVPVAEGYGRAREAVERALALEPELSEAHTVMGLIQISYDWDWRGARESFRRALELTPGDAHALIQAGLLALIEGGVDEASRLFVRALEQDPLSAAAYHDLGLAHHAAGRWNESEQSFRRALELTPHRALCHSNLALVLLAQGRDDEALAAASREPHEIFRLWALAIVHQALSGPEQSAEPLQILIDKYADDGIVQIAQVYAAREEPDAAFEWLERAFQGRDPGLPLLKSSDLLHPLHDDPRWGELLKKLGLEDERTRRGSEVRDRSTSSP